MAKSVANCRTREYPGAGCKRVKGLLRLILGRGAVDVFELGGDQLLM
jgi:hypothetical protein